MGAVRSIVPNPLELTLMPNFRMFRMKEAPRAQFRWAPHMSGMAAVKPKDYEDAGRIEAGNEYEAWRTLRDSGTPLQIGDILETEDGSLRICKYVGFEAAQWVLPEVKSGLENVPAATGPVTGPPHES
jgi:hypothetical protein